MGTAAAIVAAQRARLVREIVDHLREQKAFSPETAALVRPQQRMGRSALQSMLRDGSVVSAGEDRYWLDEAGYAAARKRRVTTVAWIGVGLALLAGIALLMQRLHGG
jgi:hypothetical protein